MWGKLSKIADPEFDSCIDNRSSCSWYDVLCTAAQKFPLAECSFLAARTDSLSNLNDILFYMQYIQFGIRFTATSDQPLVIISPSVWTEH